MTKKSEAEGQGVPTTERQADVSGKKAGNVKRDAAGKEINPEAPAPATDPVTSLSSSGAIVEPEVLESVDLNHVSVDNNPRSQTNAVQNQIDFNDPTADDAQVTAEAVKADASADGVIQPTERQQRAAERMLDPDASRR